VDAPTHTHRPETGRLIVPVAKRQARGGGIRREEWAKGCAPKQSRVLPWRASTAYSKTKTTPRASEVWKGGEKREAKKRGKKKKTGDRLPGAHLGCRGWVGMVRCRLGRPGSFLPAHRPPSHRPVEGTAVVGADQLMTKRDGKISG